MLGHVAASTTAANVSLSVGHPSHVKNGCSLEDIELDLETCDLRQKIALRLTCNELDTEFWEVRAPNSASGSKTIAPFPSS